MNWLDELEQRNKKLLKTKNVNKIVLTFEMILNELKNKESRNPFSVDNCLEIIKKDIDGNRCYILPKRTLKLFGVTFTIVPVIEFTRTNNKLLKFCCMSSESRNPFYVSN